MDVGAGKTGSERRHQPRFSLASWEWRPCPKTDPLSLGKALEQGGRKPRSESCREYFLLESLFGVICFDNKRLEKKSSPVPLSTLWKQQLLETGPVNFPAMHDPSAQTPVRATGARHQLGAEPGPAPVPLSSHPTSAGAALTRHPPGRRESPQSEPWDADEQGKVSLASVGARVGDAASGELHGPQVRRDPTATCAHPSPPFSDLQLTQPPAQSARTSRPLSGRAQGSQRAPCRRCRVALPGSRPHLPRDGGDRPLGRLPPFPRPSDPCPDRPHLRVEPGRAG
ncbi:uncharacterized protein LOC125158621 [Prionailurus viverrinus]|uniref:uncharacterized protein LOC125158621 n=1 Tax=Prionailurus viverrinus TaxID=61388 RepID=UPI001FF3FF6A|nr:uncharacterized protein LOC125158621 [Prionailurus viverrinus]